MRNGASGHRHTAILSVTHETVYRYASPVHRSVHFLRLRPVHDAAQEVLEHRLVVSPDGPRRELEDVFGNHVTQATIETPYTELRFESHATVRVTLPPPLEPGSPPRVALPLAWMPWQCQMLLPYLLPPELPESQLRELSDYAVGFAARGGHDVLACLRCMVATVHREFTYAPGSTTVATTPFEVYQRRQGVCQDFTNLVICLARLLGIPARYRVGYIKPDPEANPAVAQASHAWVEAYIPELGWRGFDPANGRVADADHVRVACGRDYRDAAPVTGTIYAGGGGETLRATVRVEQERVALARVHYSSGGSRSPALDER